MPIRDVDVVIARQDFDGIAQQGRKMARHWCRQQQLGLLEIDVLAEMQQCAERVTNRRFFVNGDFDAFDHHLVDAEGRARMRCAGSGDEFQGRSHRPRSRSIRHEWLRQPSIGDLSHEANGPKQVTLNLKRLIHHRPPNPSASPTSPFSTLWSGDRAAGATAGDAIAKPGANLKHYLAAS